MNSKLTQRLTVAFGVSMAFLMAITLFLPGLTPDQTTMVDEPPSTPSPPPPTFPPPITDFGSISFDEDYLHPSGLFAVGVPSGWVPGNPANNGQQASISMNNSAAVSVIEASVEAPPEPITSEEELGAYFTTSRLSSSWTRYASWEELSRRFEDDRLIIDFVLTQNQREFLAQHVAWTEGNWIYSARVITPTNARDLLFHMRDEMVGQIKPNIRFMDTPVGWEAYFDEIDQHILRYPDDWRQTDGDNGTPASFESGTSALALIVSADEMTIDGEDAAQAWVEARRNDASVVSVEPVERNGGSGYGVAYSYSNPDGESLSGYAVLLNGDDGQLHWLDMRIPAAAVDLNSDDIPAEYVDVAQAVGTFSLITGLNLPEPEPTVTPTIPATPETTPEMTEAVPETTPEMTESAPEETPEATPEN